jgi:hypothetical protein
MVKDFILWGLIDAILMVIVAVFLYAIFVGGLDHSFVKPILIAFLLLINIILIFQIKSFIDKPHLTKQVLNEVGQVSFIAVLNIFLFAGTYYTFGLCSSGRPIETDIVTSLYFSIVTWTTLGYGDIHPSDSIRLVAATEAFIGYIYMALIIGLFLNVIKIEVKEEIHDK